MRVHCDTLWEVAGGLGKQTSSVDAVFGESTVFCEEKTILQIHAHTNMVWDDRHALSDLWARPGVVLGQSDFSVFFAQSGYFTGREFQDSTEASVGIDAISIAGEGFASCIQDEFGGCRGAYDGSHDSGGAILKGCNTEGDFVQVIIDIRTWTNLVQIGIAMGFYGRWGRPAGDSLDIDSIGAQCVDDRGEAFRVVCPSGIVGFWQDMAGKAHYALKAEAFCRGDLSAEFDPLLARFDSCAVEPDIEIDEYGDGYAASLSGIGEEFSGGLGVDTNGEATAAFDASSGEFAESFEPILADCGVGEEQVMVCSEHAFPFADFCGGQSSGTVSDLSSGHFHGLVRFRVGAELEMVLIAVGLHPFQVAVYDRSVDEEGWGWMIFGDFVEEHELVA